MNWLIREKGYPFSYIVLGFVLHSVAKIFLNITNMQIVYSLVCVVGWFYIIRGFYLMRHELKFQFYGFQKAWVIIYMILCLVMITRGYMIDYKYLWFTTNGFINYHLFNPTYILPYLLPLLLFIPLEEYDFRPLVSASVIISLAVIFSFLFIFRQIVAGSIMASAGVETEGFGLLKYYGQLYINVSIIALCRKYVSNKIWLLNSIALILTLLINAIAARRGTTAIMSAILIFDLYFYIKTLPKRIRLLSSIVFIIGIAVVVWMSLGFKSFRYIKERGFEDNRSYIDKALMDQMTDEQLWFGKGLNGRYYFNLHLENDYLDGYRYISETGYYNLILKGGYVFAWVYILMILYPAYLGMFRSRNLLCRALGFLMFLSLLELFPFGMLTFNLKFLVIWMGVAMNSSPVIRKLDDEEVYEHYFAINNEDSMDN